MSIKKPPITCTNKHKKTYHSNYSMLTLLKHIYPIIQKVTIVSGISL